VAYRRLNRWLTDPATRHRMEIVTSSYGQPYCWVIAGESNIRHFEHGLRVHREHFPDVPVDTFAVQEPCFTSCLPQILWSFGFVRASLKNNTVFVGCVAGVDAEVVNWTGPDGTSIPAVPRYAFDAKVEMWDLQSGYSTADYAREAVRRGIAHPTGFFFQDCGWSCHPWHASPHSRRVTLREYFDTVAAAPSVDWRLTQDDLQVALPWGEKTLHQLAGFVRSAENRVLSAERMAVLGGVWAEIPWPAARLREAWEQLLLAQHHDGWACATAAIPGRRHWAWQVSAESWVTEETSREIMETMGLALCSGARRGGTEAESVRLFNPTGWARDEVAEIPLASDPGTLGVRVTDPRGREVPSQLVITRKYHYDDTANMTRVLVRAQVPPMGWSTYSVQPTTKVAPRPRGGATARVRRDGCVVLDTDLYRIIVDPSRGGVITSLRSKALRREFVARGSERLFNEFRGYLTTDGRWASTADAPAKVEIEEDGPLRVRVRIDAVFGDNSVRTVLTAAQGMRPVDFLVRFHFRQETRVGDPVEVTDVRRSFVCGCLDDRYKLQAHFPAALKGAVIHKNAAFDVCRSRHADTFHADFRDLKHNTVLNWVDLAEGDGRHGLAVFTDRTMAYAHGSGHPLSLVLGWGGKGWSWWGECPLRGLQETRYALMPHAGLWEEAGIWRESALWNEPVHGQLFQGTAPAASAVRSLLSVSDPAVELSSAVMDGGDVVLRFFNAGATPARPVVKVGFRARRAVGQELDGRTRGNLPLKRSDAGCAFTVELPPFGIRTVRLARG
jgi:alpha-mannosidase